MKGSYKYCDVEITQFTAFPGKFICRNFEDGTQNDWELLKNKMNDEIENASL